MPVTNVKSTWNNGNLIFEDASGNDIFSLFASGKIAVSGTAMSTTITELNQIAAMGYIASAETAQKTTHIAAPHAGTLAKVYITNHMAMSANGSATIVVYSSATSAGSVSLSGAASGTVSTITPTSKTVGAGGVVKAVVSASTQTKTFPVTVTAIITR